MGKERMNRMLVFIVLVLMLAPLAVFAGGQKEEPAVTSSEKEQEVTVTPDTAPDWLIENTPDHITLIDGAGRKVTVKKPVERIILMGAEPLLIAVKAIHAEKKVLAVDEATKELKTFFPMMSKLPTIGSYDNPDYEKIFEIRPDVVIAPYYTPKELEEKLEPEITVVRLDCGPPHTYAEEIRKLGHILGEEDSADEYINWFQSHMDTIAMRIEGISDEDKPRVFIYYGGDWGMTEGPPYGTYGKENIWGNSLVKMAGGINVAGELPGDWIVVDPEWVIVQNPSVVVREIFTRISGPIVGYDTDNSSEALAMRESIISQPAFEHTDAVKHEDVHMVFGDLIQCYWFIGLQYMAKWFHPELFRDIDPQAIHQEFLTEFQRLDYNLDEHGIFVYP